MSEKDNSNKQGPHFATALGQPDAQDQVGVIAHARGQQAQQMLQVARAHDIPVLQNFALSQALRRVPPGTKIPDPVLQGTALLLDFLLRHEAALAPDEDGDSL